MAQHRNRTREDQASTDSGATYKGFDANRFLEEVNHFPLPDVNPADIVVMEQMINDLQRRGATRRAMEQIYVNADRWRSISKRLDQELKAVIEQANRDAKVRLVAGMFDMISTMAGMANALEGVLDRKAIKTPPHDSEAVPDGTVREDSVRVLRVRVDGEWKDVRIERTTTDTFPHHSGMDFGATREAVSRLEQIASHVPALDCNTEAKRCAVIEPYQLGKPSSVSKPGPAFDDLGEAPSPEFEQEIYERIFSIIADATGIGDGYRVVMGKDIVTGEEESRLDAAARLVVGVLAGAALAPLIRSAKALWKLGLHKTPVRWMQDLAPGKWTGKMVDDTIEHGSSSAVRNLVNKGNGATLYEYEGTAIIIDDVTREILEIGRPGEWTRWSLDTSPPQQLP